jgi:hypothetical protein
VYLNAIEHSTFEREAKSNTAIHYSGICVTVVAAAAAVADVAAANTIIYTVNTKQTQDDCSTVLYCNDVQLIHLSVPTPVPVLAVVALNLLQ